MVGLKVEALTSVKTQLPYEYYVLPFCHDGDDTLLAEYGSALADGSVEMTPQASTCMQLMVSGSHYSCCCVRLLLRTWYNSPFVFGTALNLGEVLKGSRIYETPYIFHMGVDQVQS